MPIERKMITKPYLLLCEGRDAEGFLINYLNSEALEDDSRFSNEIQVMDFGGNDNLSNFLINLTNMDRFDSVKSLAVIRDAEKDYDLACQEVISSLTKCGFSSPANCGTWVDSNNVKVGFMLFPLNNEAGTLEDLCLRILSEENRDNVLSSIDSYLVKMETQYDRNYTKRHKNKLHTYLSSHDKFVTMPLGVASKAGAFNWKSEDLDEFKFFLASGFETID